MDVVLADLRRPLTTHIELSQRLAQHREDFEKLVSVAQDDKEVIRIAPDFTWTTSNRGICFKPLSQNWYLFLQWD